jgi:hypothetical protein
MTSPHSDNTVNNESAMDEVKGLFFTGYESHRDLTSVVLLAADPQNFRYTERCRSNLLRLAQVLQQELVNGSAKS